MKTSIILRRHSVIMLFATLLLSLVFSCTLDFHSAQAKTKGARFKKKISHLTVGKKFRYQIKYLPKKAKVSYSCNHRTIAAIHKKKGILTAKKKGKVTICAKIVTNGKRAKKLKTSVRIVGQKKSSATAAPAKNSQTISAQTAVLPNTTLKVSKQINPWNHSFILYSSRILLQKEIKDTHLTLTKTDEQGAENHLQTVTANFVSLSDDGKNATYQIADTDAASMCPGNGTANGKYLISGSLFANTMPIHYEERLSPNEIRGFGFDTNENTLSDLEVSLYRESHDTDTPSLVSTTHTGQNGYYSFEHLPNGRYHLVFSKENFLTVSSASFTLEETIHCENVSLKSQHSGIVCQIQTPSSAPLPGIPVSLQNKDGTQQWQGYTDKQGLLSFSNMTESESTCYTKLSYRSGIQRPKIIQDTMPLPASDSRIVSDSFSPMDEYILTVCPEASSHLPYTSVSLTFSPENCPTEQSLFDIMLDSAPILQASSLSIKQDTSKASATFDNTGSLSAQATSLQVQLLHADGCPIFSDAVSINILTSAPQDITDAINTIFQNAELRLPDGSYYMTLQPMNATRQFTHAPHVSKVTIANGILSPIHTSFLSGIVTKIMLTGDFPSQHGTISCTLYERTASGQLPIATLQSTDFEMLTDSCFKAYLNCCPLLPNHTYCLESADAEIGFTGNNTFTPKEDTVETNPMEPTVPSLQIVCRLKDTPVSAKDPAVMEHHYSHASVMCDASFFQNTVNIKNCVYAYYKYDGSLCSVFWANEAEQHYFNDKNDIIAFYDKLQSGKTIQTSQPAYRFSSMYK